MNILGKDQLHLVKPMFRKMVQAAWDRGEDVPYGVVLLSDEPPTEAELVRTREVAKKYNLDNL